ncbi:MAG TPA: extracellular solute-binding protein, partial [Trebonia sp.]|nr:extracellular solute-binding protein [Trebonia sp.]
MPAIRRLSWRVVAAASVSLLVVGTAAACSSSGSSSSSGSAGSSASGPVTLTEFDYYTGPTGSDAALNEYNAAFMKAHPNVTIKRTSVPYANLITKILQDATAGDMPNLLIIDNPDVPEVAATGQLVAFNNLPGFTTSGYTAGAISECTYQGKQYCYPIGTNTVGIFYNKAMLAAAHVSPPTT